MNQSAGKVIVYIRNSLYDGKKANDDGYYCFTRKELADHSRISVTTLDRCKDEICYHLRNDYDFSSWAKYKELSGESLYLDVAYEKGVLRFKRNPLTFQPEYAFLWGLPSLNYYFSYDCFDEKHRRRCNSRKMEFDAIPWSWNADEYEAELAQARADIQAHQSQGK